MQNTMKQIPNRKSSQKIQADALAMRLFFGLALFLMACSGVFGQTQNSAPQQEPATEIRLSETSDQMHMMLWIMGGRQHVPASVKRSSEGTSVRKQLIESGATPNRILRQTLLKKAMSHDSALAWDFIFIFF